MSNKMQNDLDSRDTGFSTPNIFVEDNSLVSNVQHSVLTIISSFLIIFTPPITQNKFRS